MKKGAALSLVLALGGTTMFCVTQGVCARACGVSHTGDSNAPARTSHLFFFILVSRSWRVSRARWCAEYVEGSSGGQGAVALRVARWDARGVRYVHAPVFMAPAN
jgi:hypothetical protein